MKCLECSKEFEPKRSNHRFCSVKCKDRYKSKRRYTPVGRKKFILVCETCQKEFTGNKAAKFCSELCRHKAHWKRHKVVVERFCRICGVSIGNNGWLKLCSKCKQQAKKQRKKKPVERQPIACSSCMEIFFGTKREKRCHKCRNKNSPALLFAITKAVHKIRSITHGTAFGFSRRDWLRALSHFNNRCAYCGQEKKLHQDHFVPVVAGGGYTKNNIVPACQTCNSSKSDTDPRIWLSPAKYRQIAEYLNRA